MTKRLELDSSLDGLILARESVVYSENPSLANVLTATMTVDVMVKATRRGGASRTWSFTASGAGFNQTVAHNLATERIEKQLNADTNMSLAIISTPTRP